MSGKEHFSIIIVYIADYLYAIYYRENVSLLLTTVNKLSPAHMGALAFQKLASLVKPNGITMIYSLISLAIYAENVYVSEWTSLEAKTPQYECSKG